MESKYFVHATTDEPALVISKREYDALKERSELLKGFKKLLEDHLFLSVNGEDLWFTTVDLMDQLKLIDPVWFDLTKALKKSEIKEHTYVYTTDYTDKE